MLVSSVDDHDSPDAVWLPHGLFLEQANEGSGAGEETPPRTRAELVKAIFALFFYHLPLLLFFLVEAKAIIPVSWCEGRSIRTDGTPLGRR